LSSQTIQKNKSIRLVQIVIKDVMRTGRWIIIFVYVQKKARPLRNIQE